MNSLAHILDAALEKNPEKIAIEHREKTITYRELDRFSSAISAELTRNGAATGERIGIYAGKSIETAAAILGSLKAGATYVPVGVDSPASRNAFIFEDCNVKFIIAEEKYAAKLRQVWNEITVILELAPEVVLLKGPVTDKDEQTFDPQSELAYILYTSGSTGNPKGVMYSHKSALKFIEWCSQTFPVTNQDRFSSHAPFHFDLSIFDLYVSFLHGSTLILIDEETGKNPMELGKLIPEKKISVWYSTPSVLALLAQYGKLEKYDYSNLRLVLFAGEVFPIKHLRALVELWTQARFFNLYGPTETNVCTYFEIPKPVPPDRSQPFPIGKSCSHLQCQAFDENGIEVKAGEKAELCVSGDIMSGYWNLPEKTQNAFITDRNGRTQWYKTGDIVIKEPDGNFLYFGRKDRMVKRRGYRVELGEIEAMLYKHPEVREAAVVAVPDGDAGVQIRAFLHVVDREKVSLIKMKQYASEVLPSYMIPDQFTFLPELPKTSTDKIDYQKLLIL